jgi:hypothetical protein
MRGKYEDLIEVLALAFPRRERIVLWLLAGVSYGMLKAGDWMQQGVPQNVALSLGAAVTFDVLLMIWVLYEMLTTGVRVGLRLWPRRKR